MKHLFSLSSSDMALSLFATTVKKALLYRLPPYRMKMGEVKAWIFRYVFTYSIHKIAIYTALQGTIEKTL